MATGFKSLDQYPTVSTLDFLVGLNGTANVNITPAALLESGAPKVTITGGAHSAMFYIGHELSGVAANELVLKANVASGNVLVLYNNAANGFSALTGLNELGDEVFAIGHGNSGVPLPFQNYVYFEVSDAANGGSAPGLLFVQSTTYEGTTTYGIFPRLAFLPDGTLRIYSRETAGTQMNAAFSLLTLDSLLPVLSLGTTGNTGKSYGRIQAVPGDAAASITLREAQLNVNRHRSYGGTLANAEGHQFYTGGLEVAQSLRFHIADNGIVQIAPATAASNASLFNGSIHAYLDEGGNNLKFKVKYSGGTVKTGTVALV